MLELKDFLVNFRDFGGVKLPGGSRVRSDMLYRSGAFYNDGPSSVLAIAEIDFDTVVDLRYPDERHSRPSPWPDCYGERLFAHCGHANKDAPHLALFRAAPSGKAAVAARFSDFYAALPFDRNYQQLFARVFTHLALSKGRMLVHCSAGKDRTGVFCALLLSALGVEWREIIDDYLISHQASQIPELRKEVAERAALHGVNPLSEAMIEAILGVDQSYLEATFEAIIYRCGSVDGYFDLLGVDQDKLRQRFII